MREEFFIEKIYFQINDIIRDPKTTIEKYLKDNEDKTEEKKFKNEILENNEKIESYYRIVDELYDNWITERNTAFKEIIQGKIDRNRSSIESLEARNKELKEFIQSKKDIIENSKEIMDFAKQMKGKDIYNLTREETIKFLNLVVKKITVNDDEIHVILTINRSDE